MGGYPGAGLLYRGRVSEDPLLSTVLAERYRIDALVGEGAMGRVYRAEHVLMRKRVAVKVLHRELLQVPEIVQRFEREAQAAAHIEHPHVAAATDFGRLPDGRVYLVLEYVEGRSLTEVIAEGGLSLQRVLAIGAQIAAALEAAHARGIVHRDLKPDNVSLVEISGEEDFVKVLDFGVAKVQTESQEGARPITQVGMVYGTPEYMAPEQALGQEVDGRADLYALGVLLYELCTGQRPYAGPVVGLLGQQLSKPIPVMAERVAGVTMPAAVERFVRALLAPNPSDRVSSATAALETITLLHEEFLAPLQSSRRGSMRSAQFDEVLGRGPLSTQHFGGPASAPTGRRLPILLLAALALPVGAGVAYFAVARGEPEPAPVVASAPPVLPSAPAQLSEADLVPLVDAARAVGSTALLGLAERYPAEARIQEALSVAYAKERKYQEALDAAKRATELDPKLNESREISGALYRAAQAKNVSDEAFRFLRTAMGARGADIIYDLSVGATLRPWVKAEAARLLAQPEVLESASPELAVTIRLSHTRDCEALAALVRQAATTADARALPRLHELEHKSGCGSHKSGDCYPCLRSGELLTGAIAAIEARRGLTAPSGSVASTDTAVPMGTVVPMSSAASMGTAAPTER